MATPYFFDTAALQHRYVNSEHSRRVRYLVSRHNGSAYIADWTMLEMPSGLARRCRGAGLGIVSYDRLHSQFIGDVAKGRLIVRHTGVREILRARHMIRFAGITKKKNLGAGDALIASCALELARELQQTVTLCTSDWGLYLSLRELNAFRAALNLVLVGKTKNGTPSVCRCLPGALGTE